MRPLFWNVGNAAPDDSLCRIYIRRYQPKAAAGHFDAVVVSSVHASRAANLF